MIKKLLFILFLIVLNFSSAFAVTEFVATVKGSGGDYTTLQAAETALQNDITAATIKVFSISAHAGTFTDGVAVDNGSGVSGVMVHANVAGTQVLIKSIAGGTFASGNVVWVTANHAITATFSDNGDSPIIGIACYASAAPDGATTIDGWTTDATHYIHIYTPISERHHGVYDTSKYRIETVNNATPLAVSEGFVRIDGLQLYLQSSNATDPRVLQVYESGTQVINATYYITNNIIRGHTDSAQATFQAVSFFSTGAGTAKAYLYNNLIYNVQSSNDANERGIQFQDVDFTFYAYNNTIANVAGIGMNNNTSTAVYAINNLFYNNATDALGTYVKGTSPDDETHNAADSASIGYTVTGGAVGDRTSQTFSFVNSSAGNFDLLPNDNGAKNYGVNLSISNYLPFNVDIDDSIRPGQSIWDIGMDEVFPIIQSFEEWE